MKRTIRRTLLAVSLYCAGLATGIAGTTHVVFSEGEKIGARIVKLGIIIANAGDTDLAWTVAVDHDPPPAPPPLPVVRVAKKGK